MHKGRRTGWRNVSVRCMTVAMLGSLMLAPWGDSASAEGASPQLRVGLMINSDAFQTAADTVTVQGKTGLNAGFYTNGVFASRFAVADTVKASLDNYFITVGDYESAASAQDAADRLDGMGLSSDIYVEMRGGKKVYQVVTGYYESYTQAESALARVQPSFGNGARMRGYMRLTTGPVGGQQQAEAKANELRGQGLEAYPLVRQNGTWEVWVGNEATAAHLQALQAKVPGATVANYKPADYMLIKTGYSVGKEIPHTIQCSSDEEIAFLPSGDSQLLKVAEKARTYHGAILVQGYREKANVINSVPLEEYLYGVLPYEMSSGWPLEALKAQAVAARTYASRLIGKNKWGVADMVDDTYDQAYYGTKLEAADTTQAVNDTRGQVLTYNGKLIEALYSSNNGGQNGDVQEMWGSQGFPYLTAVDSSADAEAAKNEPLYYRVQLSSGQIGWIKAQSVKKGANNGAGFATGTISQSGPLRIIPEASATVLSTPAVGTNVIIFNEEKEYNPFNWQRGPYSPSEMQGMTGSGQPVYDLRVTKYGQAGRIMEVSANGEPVDASKPDYYRATFDNLWSTKVQIEQTGTYTVLGANGVKTEYPDAGLNGQKLNVISASGTVSANVNGNNPSFVVLDGSGKNRVVTKQQSFIFHGNGYGHGLGMSQWGANGMAKQGYTYDQILAHYYPGVSLNK
ncbi:MAG: SpoIID/LytB domain-containing protein [Tumebacillaceae bacterium]